VTTSRYLGAGTRLTIAVDGAEVALIVPAGDPVPAPGGEVRLAWAADAVQPLADA
jgi:putative spermidine/putrescine transport system ATP-binding protein